MSPRSPDGRSIKDLAAEEDREQHYSERQEPEDESDPFDKKETSWAEETVHEEFTSRRPPSPFASFLRETGDSHAPSKEIVRTFEDRMPPNEQLEGCTSDDIRIHEFPNADLSRKGLSKLKSSGEAEGWNEEGNFPVEGATGVATEPDEHLNPHIIPASSPEQAANFLSRLTFWWINSLMWTGFKKPLEIVDLPSLPDWDDADGVHKRFSTVWRVEQQKVKPSLLKALYKVFWPKLLAAAALQLLSVLLQFTPSIFHCDNLLGESLLAVSLERPLATILLFLTVNSLLTYIQGTPTKNFMFRIFGQHFGYYTAAALLIVPTFRSLTDNAILQIMLRMGMNMKTALIKTVYHKSLKLSNSARQSRSVGEIVILMQVDTEKVNGASPFLQNTWSALVQVLGNVALLLYYMGWSSLVGIGLLLLIVPLQVINEVLQGVRVVKAYAWEEPFTSTINRVRDLELRSMRSRVYLRAVQTCVMLATPVLITVVSFAIYAGVQKKNMTAATVFTSLSLFNSLRQPLMMYPFVINGVLTGYVSLKRLSRFMQSEEMHSIPSGPIVDDKPVLYIENSTFQWISKSVGGLDSRDSSSNRFVTEDTSKRNPTVSTSGVGIQAFCLKNLSLTVNRGQIVAIVGPVGSGKSSLAAALLGEMQQVSGDTFTANGRLAYCAQQAWIMNASLKDNILFGLEYDDVRYRAVLTACALDQDLVNLPDGDETEIGERGINLSGGQKQRVSLARAVYADMDVYLLDDPLSAVDAHVGAHLFSKCIMGFLSDKTRIFITNQLQYAPSVDHIMVLEEGRVAEQGKFQDLVSKEGEFSRLIQETGIQKEDESDIDTSDTMSPVNWGGVERKILRRTKFCAKASSYSGKGMLVQDEYRTRGTLDLSVYKNYWTETSYVMPLCVLALYCAVQCLDAFNRYWLAYWTKDHFHQSTAFYLGIYAGLGIFFAGLLYFRMLSQLMLGLWTAKKFHEGVLQSILRAPMSFFDTTPVGRILNRFSADQQAVDETLPFTWVSFLNILFQAFSTIIVISLNTPIFLLIFLPTSVLYAFIQQVYRRTARELKHLGSLSISPVYQQFTETLNGLPTIRAYQQEDRFMEMCAGKLNVTNRAYMLLQSCNRWLSVRLEFMGNLMVFCAALLAVSKKGTLYAGYAGISIDYAMQITASLNMLVRTMTDTENQMNAIERMLEYRHRIVHEGPPIPDQLTPPKHWPTEGTISFENLEMRYRPGLPLVLKGVSMEICGGEVVGVVGRTGSGKSSLMLCLFRLVEPASGSIKIDGIDIGKITLKDLRSRLSIIPQEPILFSGTVRTNIDPFSAYSDDEVWRVLEHSHLKDKVSELPDKLDADVAEYGENFSVGERQLLCLARVLLRSCRILVMDEATSSVDFETDKLIQAKASLEVLQKLDTQLQKLGTQGTIRNHLQGTTLLIIAHRINTVIDASRVLVLSHGKLVEYDTPAALLERPDGRFASLIQDTGEANAAHLIRLANSGTAFFSPQRNVK